jgi:hypothetical protein
MCPGRYQHDKSRTYTVTGVARHSKTDEERMVDRPENGDRRLWAGPLAMFQETVTIDEQEVPRFEFQRTNGEQQ